MQKMKSLRKARSELDDERTDGRRTAGSQMAAVQVRIRQRQRTDGIRVSDELDLIVVIGQQSGDVKHCLHLCCSFPSSQNLKEHLLKICVRIGGHSFKLGCYNRMTEKPFSNSLNWRRLIVQPVGLPYGQATILLLLLSALCSPPFNTPCVSARSVCFRTQR